MENGPIQGVPRFWGYPLLSLEREKPMNIFGEKGAWAYPGTAQFFWVPLLFQERVKLRISNFKGTFIGWIRTKAHEKCWE